MKNPKTTTGGYLLILAALVSAVGKFMAGQMPDMADGTLLITGIGFILARDGSH